MTRVLNSDILLQILEEAKFRNQKEEPLYVVFDLDSTLFNVISRSQQILKEFIAAEHLPEHMDIINALQSVTLVRTDHGLASALKRHSLEVDDNFKRRLIEFWRDRFFSNDYLNYDEPFEGAPEYVNALFEGGAHIHYLTGRDVERMGVGTPKVLKKWSFPMDTDRVRLTMKPVQGLDDVQFKVDELIRLNSAHWFFENEPNIIRAVEANLPSLKVVYFDSSHSGRAEPKDEWIKIQHFKVK